MDKRIVVAVDGQWFVRYEGEKQAEIVSLFGTDTLATPFSVSTPIEKVMARLAALNPEASILRDDLEAFDEDSDDSIYGPPYTPWDDEERNDGLGPLGPGHIAYV